MVGSYDADLEPHLILTSYMRFNGIDHFRILHNSHPSLRLKSATGKGKGKGKEKGKERERKGKGKGKGKEREGKYHNVSLTGSIRLLSLSPSSAGQQPNLRPRSSYSLDVVIVRWNRSDQFNLHKIQSRSLPVFGHHPPRFLP